VNAPPPENHSTVSDSSGAIRTRPPSMDQPGRSAQGWQQEGSRDAGMNPGGAGRASKGGSRP
jgi:hypothetical protein